MQTVDNTSPLCENKFVKTIFPFLVVSLSLVSCDTVKKMNADDWNKVIDIAQKGVQDARALGADVNEIKAALDEVKAREEAEAKAEAAVPVSEVNAGTTVIITGGK